MDSTAHGASGAGSSDAQANVAVSSSVSPPKATDATVKRETDGDEPMESPRDAADPPRWNRDEHARFMQALETFGGERTGDEWRKIAAFVQTRSLDEVRFHGQQYLQHLVQIHRLQQQQLQQQQQQQQQYQHQQRLLQLSRMSGDGFPLSASSNQIPNQNDANVSSNTINSARAKGRPSPSPSALSAAAQSVANAMNAHAVPSVVVRKPPSHAVSSGGGEGGNATGQRGKPKTWTFHEDKIMETTLAAWQRGKPYSWPKIAASLPGKTAKDVRLRYEQLVDDIASIDTSHLAAPPPPPRIPSTSTSSSSSSSSVVGRPPPHAGLSSRIAPPPPIQVPPLPSSRAKTESPGLLPASLRGRFALTPSFGGASGMLSPTFLDFLASEDKPPLPAFAAGGIADLPSPLLPSPLGLDLRTTPSGGGGAGGGGGSARGSRRSLGAPRGATTPRIWHDFLADDFRFEPKGPYVAAAPASDAASGGCGGGSGRGGGGGGGGGGDLGIVAVRDEGPRRSDDSKRE